ncbi:uncharacterized protein FOMMEDRAFT_162127 [Fomitiporia mediterranea MF3/22]|uniref:uncharacterized protein n=1 Tax=Fomitiporia mediterranea (strain MF3/22) TaxID=694068 RepID=UPI00044094FB|nr:uncharacterized protein FOMMEDRAFT_162127 [Fomitiporia mediterranea MF3/22]EJC98329.1 hypothetical protein FOMMEDRAFT_162127 [Fomitiporia mediterranea MF3/22]
MSALEKKVDIAKKWEIIKSCFWKAQGQKAAQGRIKLERGFAAIPLPSIDVPFYSRYLWAGVMQFHLSKKANVLLINWHILTSSPHLDKIFKKDNWSDDEHRQRTAYTVLVELLAYHFASPCKWPSPMLTDMAVRTLKPKYETQDESISHVRAILCHLKNTKEICCEFEDEVADAPAGPSESAAPAITAAPAAIPASSAVPAAKVDEEHRLSKSIKDLVGGPPALSKGTLTLPIEQLLEDVRMAEQATPALSGGLPVAETNGIVTPPPVKRALAARRPSTSPPTIRRSDTSESARPKCEIHPPPPKYLPYAESPKSMQSVRKAKADDGTEEQLRYCDPVKLGIPNYPKIVKKPMVLCTMRKKLDNGEYPNVQSAGTAVLDARVEIQRVLEEKWFQLPPLKAPSEDEGEDEDSDDDLIRAIADMAAQIETMKGNLAALNNQTKEKVKEEKRPPKHTSPSVASASKPSNRPAKLAPKKKSSRKAQISDMTRKVGTSDQHHPRRCSRNSRCMYIDSPYSDECSSVLRSSEEIEINTDQLSAPALLKLYNFRKSMDEDVEVEKLRQLEERMKMFDKNAVVSSGVKHEDDIESIWADLNGGIDRLPDLAEITTYIRLTLNKQAELRRAIIPDNSADFTIVKDGGAGRVLQTVTVTPRANFEFESSRQMPLEVVVTDHGEVGPWGSSHGLDDGIDQALRCKSREPVDDKDDCDKYEKDILARAAVQFIEPELLDGYDPKKKTSNQEIELIHDLELLEFLAEEAKLLKHEHSEKCVVWLAEGNQRRTVDGQTPAGWHTGCYCIPQDIIDHVDRCTLWAMFPLQMHSIMSRYAAPGVLVVPVRSSQLTLCALIPPSMHAQDFVFFPQWSAFVGIHVGRYDVSPRIAMQIYHPILNDAITGHAKAWYSEEATEKRLKAALTAKRKPIMKVKPEPNGPAESEKMELDTVEQKPGERGENKEVLTAEVKAKENPAPKLQALFHDCKQTAPGNTFDITGPSFYLSFWQMSSYYLYYPKEKYSEVEKTSARAYSGSLRVQYDRYLATISKLRQEKAAQESVYSYTAEKGGRLDRERDHWFSHVGTGAGLKESPRSSPQYHDRDPGSPNHRPMPRNCGTYVTVKSCHRDHANIELMQSILRHVVLYHLHHGQAQGTLVWIVEQAATLSEIVLSMILGRARLADGLQEQNVAVPPIVMTMTSLWSRPILRDADQESVTGCGNVIANRRVYA